MMMPLSLLFLHVVLYLLSFSKKGVSAPSSSLDVELHRGITLSKRVEPLKPILERLTLESFKTRLSRSGLGEEYSWVSAGYPGSYSYHTVCELSEEDKEITQGQLMTVAFRAYESLKQEFEGNVILTAIFIPKVAIIIQTKVHSPQAATEIINMANEHVKRWYKKVYEPRREANPTLAIEKLIHAEDGAVVRGGNAYAKSFGLTSLGELVRLPKKTKVANYGKYHAGDTAGPKQSCAQWCRGMLELMIAPDT